MSLPRPCSTSASSLSSKGRARPWVIMPGRHASMTGRTPRRARIRIADSPSPGRNGPRFRRFWPFLSFGTEIVRRLRDALAPGRERGAPRPGARPCGGRRARPSGRPRRRRRRRAPRRPARGRCGPRCATRPAGGSRSGRRRRSGGAGRAQGRHAAGGRGVAERRSRASASRSDGGVHVEEVDQNMRAHAVGRSRQAPGDDQAGRDVRGGLDHPGGQVRGPVLSEAISWLRLHAGREDQVGQPADDGRAIRPPRP